MVTQKTSKDDMKKISEPIKSASKKTKSADVKADVAAKKPVAKKTPKVDNTPVVANKDVVASVLEIKAKNEAKKATKPAKTVKAASPVVMEEKGARAISTKNKRDIVKGNAQKAEARKFLEQKEEESAQNRCSRPVGYRKNGWKEIFEAWIDGYKNMFNYKERTSRFDFWSFMLVNFFVTLFIVAPYDWTIFNAQATKTVVNPSIILAYWLFTLFEILVYLPLFVRRLHDINYSGWKGYFRELIYFSVGLIALMIIGNKTYLTATDATNAFWGIAFLGVFFFALYYSLKIFITAGFIEGDYEDNAYGTPTAADRFCKRRILRMATVYILLATIYLTITFCIQMSFEMKDYCYALLFN